MPHGHARRASSQHIHRTPRGHLRRWTARSSRDAGELGGALTAGARKRASEVCHPQRLLGTPQHVRSPSCHPGPISNALSCRSAKSDRCHVDQSSGQVREPLPSARAAHVPSRRSCPSSTRVFECTTRRLQPDRLVHRHVHSAPRCSGTATTPASRTWTSSPFVVHARALWTSFSRVRRAGREVYEDGACKRAEKLAPGFARSLRRSAPAYERGAACGSCRMRSQIAPLFISSWYH